MGWTETKFKMQNIVPGVSNTATKKWFCNPYTAKFTEIGTEVLISFRL